MTKLEIGCCYQVSCSDYFHSPLYKNIILDDYGLLKNNDIIFILKDCPFHYKILINEEVLYMPNNLLYCDFKKIT